MSRLSVLLFDFLLLGFLSANAPPLAAAPRHGVESIRRDLEVLRIPSMEGLDPATPVPDSTASLVVRRIQAAGFAPFFGDSSYAQPVVVWIAVRPQGTNGMRDARRSYAAMVDWVPLGFTREGRLSGAPVVAAGRGLRIPSQGIDDYAGIDVSGAVVLAVDGLPTGAGRAELPFASRRAKAALAHERGAAGILFVADPASPDPPYDSIPLNGLYTDTQMLAARMRRTAADALLAGSGISIDAMARGGSGSRGRLPGVDLEWIVSMRRLKAAPQNLAGILRGTGAGCVVITAPIHAGDMGGRYENQEFHLGSAGHAAGVATLLDLAARLESRRGRLERLEKSVILAFTVARDQDMEGTRALMMNLAVSGLQIDAVVAVDRPGARGTDAVVGWAEPRDALWIDRLRGSIDLGLDPTLPLDGRVFREAGIPVLQLHGPTADWFDTDADTPDRVDAERLARISAILETIVVDLCAAPAGRR